MRLTASSSHVLAALLLASPLAAEVRAMEGKAAAARDSTSGPSLPLDRYAGTYRDPGTAT